MNLSLRPGPHSQSRERDPRVPTCFRGVSRGGGTNTDKPVVSFLSPLSESSRILTCDGLLSHRDDRCSHSLSAYAFAWRRRCASSQPSRQVHSAHSSYALELHFMVVSAVGFTFLHAFSASRSRNTPQCRVQLDVALAVCCCTPEKVASSHVNRDGAVRWRLRLCLCCVWHAAGVRACRAARRE